MRTDGADLRGRFETPPDVERREFDSCQPTVKRQKRIQV